MNNDTKGTIEDKGLQPTAMRVLVYDVLKESDSALSLYEIEQRFDKVERSTIFRTLKLFQENSLVHSVYDGTGAVRYAPCDLGCTCGPDDLHVHFLCNRCQKSYCLRDLHVPEMKLPEGFDSEGANFVITGTCPDCGY